MKLIYKVSFLALSLLFGLTSCDHLIFDNLEDCPRGIYVRLYSQTECADSPSYSEQIRETNYFVFDEETGLLIALHRDENQTLTADKEVYIPISRSKGVFRVIAWSGIASNLFETSSVQIGKTSLSDLYSILNTDKETQFSVDLKDRTVWMGQSPIVVVQPLRKETPKDYHVAVNMREITNRITVRVTGLKKPTDFVILMESANGRYGFDGTIPAHSAYKYPALTSYPADLKDMARAFFTTLKLESGRKSIITVFNTDKDKIAFQDDLIGAILMSPKDASLNLRCLNDYDIHLKMRYCPTCPGEAAIAQIWINDWLVHSYDISFD